VKGRCAANDDSLNVNQRSVLALNLTDTADEHSEMSCSMPSSVSLVDDCEAAAM
jgi:hypothetical protein